MTKSLRIFLSFLTCASFISCEKTTTDEFEETNGEIKDKLIKTITVISTQDATENKNFTLSYNSGNRLTTISNGKESSVFVFQDNKLANIVGEHEDLTIEELYESPYDAFETGEVYEYDSNGNPYLLKFLEQEYNYQTGYYDTKEYTAEVQYDNTPNPYFFTLESAGIIEVLDRVKLNFSLTYQASEIVQARLLFPKNNPSSITYRNEEGKVIHTINIDYDYDKYNYPLSATVTSVSTERQETYIYLSSFTYLD